ncbi:MAG: FxsA family protein, partial [Marinobacter sp.]|nr:FxsA family protein [Marinobacter sp.]
MGVFFLLFVILPIVEMTILIKVGAVIGALNTIGLVLLTAVLGAALLRQQGLATLLKANQRLNSGELPAKEVAEGLILAVGGALLLTPGFV